MSVNHEVKGNLARLLATEDLVVEHKKVSTACFNVHTRVLTLPMWEKASNAIYDMLVGHEVGHALYTPDDDWWDTCKVPKQIVNVVEDVRVEKLMKRRYDGLKKTFYNGYSELNDQDFFAIGDEDVDTYNLADKVNLYYKIGNFINIGFDEKEKEIVDIVGKTETFADVLIASELLYAYCKEKQEHQQKVESLNSHDQSTPGNNTESGDQQEQESENNSDTQQTNDQGSSTEGQSQEGIDNVEGESQSNNNIGSTTSNIDVKTSKALEESIKDLVNNVGTENVYIEIPKLNLDTVIICNKQIHEECNKTWKATIEVDEKPDAFINVDKKYVDFKRSAQKEVNYLVKEFECRKSADSYARATTSRTGILDCSKLHTYKYNEDLFKKVTTLANGKNHGLVFILDWSGSMSDVLLDTVKQLYNLIWFCKKVNIPFDVYAFTNEWRRVTYDDGKPVLPKPHYNKKSGLIFVDENFSLLNVLTSKVSGSVLEQQMKNMFRVAYGLNRTHYNYSYTEYNIPYGLSLSGTPLNQSLIALHQILPKFKKDNKLQKVQCIILTDGEAEWSKYHLEFNRPFNTQPYIGLNSISSNTTLRDRKIGMVYKMTNDNNDFTELLLRNLRDKFDDVNFIGIRIMQGRDASNFIRRYVGYSNNDQYVKMMNGWKKYRNISIKNSGYNTYFGLSSSALNASTEFDVHECATKTQIKSAFVKSLSSKKMNKKILNEFVGLIC
jgi:hypothetical protein